MKELPKLVSGVKPTGRPHIGNYFGAMRQFVELQETHRSYIFVANYHALTSMTDASLLRQYTTDIILDYLAIGLDPKKTIIFLQSDVPEHIELSWIFNCLTTVPYLSRAHAYKDALAKQKEVTVGVFDYPMLMAADILLYDPDIVPVGYDQKQHLEIARDTALKFNRIFGETFTLPTPHIPKETEIIPGIDGQKMSKSYNNTIPLFAPDLEIQKNVMSIVTDSKGETEAKDPKTCTVFALHRLFSEKELTTLEKRYKEGSISYKESKELLAQNIISFITPLRERRKALEQDLDTVMKIVRNGGEIARSEAKAKMRQVRQRVGLL